MVSNKRFEFTHQLSVTAQGQVRLDAVLERCQPTLLEAGDFDLGEVGVCELGKRRAPPQGQRVLQRRGRGRRVARAKLRSTNISERVETRRVELDAIKFEAVTTRERLHIAVAQGLSKPGHVHLKRLVRVAGRVALIEPLDDAVG